MYCPSPNEYPEKYDDEVPVILELWGMWSPPSLPLLPGPLWPGVVVPDRVLSMGQIRLTAYLWLTELFEIEMFLTIKLCNYIYTVYLC